MAGWVDLGRVMCLPKGEYSAETTYEINDYVTFGHGAFICLKACKGVEPVVGQTTEYWQEFGPALKPANYTEAGIVKADTNTMYVDSNGTIKPALDVTYDKNTKTLSLKDKNGNIVGSGTLIESSGAADVEWVEADSKLYLVDDEGNHIGNGATLSISGGAGVLEVDWATYLAAKATYDAMDMIIICPDAPGSFVVSADGVTYDNTESGMDATNAQDAIDEISSDLKDLITGIISTGDTSITLTDSRIKTDSIVDIYFIDKVMAPTDVTVNNGSITIEIEAQEEDISVGVRCM